MKKLIALFAMALLISSTIAQNNFEWESYNRILNKTDILHLNAQSKSGYAKIKDLNFANGTIELEIKGKDQRGRSFVGFAFHGVNDSTYDAVYFRPFNFLSATKGSNAAQYISHPKHTWYQLREAHPGIYENEVSAKPDPNEWFKVKIIINYPDIIVYVNGFKKPVLEVKQLSKQKEGWLGIWTGNGSEGWFRNLKITKD